MVSLSWRQILTLVLGLSVLTPSVHAESSGGYVIYMDPFSMGILVFVIGFLVVLFTYLLDRFQNNHTMNQVLTTYQATTQVQNNIMQSLAQAVTTHLFVQTGLMAEETRHRMDMDNKWYNLMAQQQAFMQYIENRHENTYEKQVTANIDFMNRIFDLVAMQTAFKDIEELNRDKIRASVVRSAMPYEIEIVTTEKSSGSNTSGTTTTTTTTTTK